MLALLVMSALLGASSFLFGVIPLSFSLSKHHITRFSTLGSGILIGTALGVIIPEGIETLASAHPSEKLPTAQIALSLISGFIFMLVVEQLVSPHSHSHSHSSLPSNTRDNVALHTVGDRADSTVEFDAEMGDLEQPDPPSSGFMQVDMDEIKASRARAYPLTFGLLMHGLADGLALGVSSLSHSGESSDPSHRDLSFIVFLALIIHKAPTSLALTTSLLNTSLPRPECKKHLTFFAASTPVGAIVSYAVLSLFSAGAQGSWTGLALLVSGGTFLYVATVLTVSHSPDDAGTEDMSPTLRVGLIAAGIILPYIISHLALPDVH